LANALVNIDHFAEAKALISETLPTARRVCGDAHDTTINLQYMLSRSTVLNPDATQKDVLEAKEELECLLGATRRIFGQTHPRVRIVQTMIERANRRL